MTDDNPYQVSPGAQAVQVDVPVSSRRSPLEWIVLASLAAFPVFYAILAVLGRLTPSGPHQAIGVSLFIAFAIVGLAAMWLLWRRSREGAIASVVFYGIQIVSITVSGSYQLGFWSLPTIDFALNPHSSVIVKLNLVAVILLFLSVCVWREYVGAEDLKRN